VRTRGIGNRLVLAERREHSGGARILEQVGLAAGLKVVW